MAGNDLHHSYSLYGNGQAWCACYSNPTSLAAWGGMQIMSSFYRRPLALRALKKKKFLNHGFDLKVWQWKSHPQNSLCFLKGLRGESVLLLDFLLCGINWIWPKIMAVCNWWRKQIFRFLFLKKSMGLSFRQQNHPWAMGSLYKRPCFNFMQKTKAVLNTGRQPFHSLHWNPSRRETNCVRVLEEDLTFVLSCCVSSYKHIQDWKYLAVLSVWKHNGSQDD